MASESSLSQTDRVGTGSTSSTGGTRSSGTRRAFLGMVGSGATVALAGCIGSTGGTGSTENPELNFQMHWYRNHTGTFAPLTAAEEWTWPDHGMDVTVKNADGSLGAAKAIASGDNPVGEAGLGAALQVIEEGAPLTMIGNYMGPFGGVVFLEESGISTWKDLEGKTIGQYPWGSTGPIAKAAMREEGVDLSTISFQNVDPGSARKLQLNGQLDAMIRYVPQELTWLDVNGYDGNAFRSVDVLNHMGSGLLVRDDFLEEHPEQVSNVVAGWLDGITMWSDQHEKVTEVHKSRAEEEASEEWNDEYYEAITGTIFAAYAPDDESVGTSKGKGWIESDRLQSTIDLLSQTGLLDSKLDAESISTNRFIEENKDLAVGAAESLYTTLESYDVGPDAI